MGAKKILVIDDEEIICRTLVKGLEKCGYDVMVAKNGNDALVFTEEEAFDLIISDIRMPGRNGVETVRDIFEKAESRGKKIPVIFITGFADADLEAQARELNPAAFIHKPFDYLNFLEQVKRALGE